MDTPGIRTHGGNVSSQQPVDTNRWATGGNEAYNFSDNLYTCLTHAHGGRGGTVRENVTNVSARRRDGLLVVAGRQLVESRPRGGCRERQGGVNCLATAAATTQPRVLLPSRGSWPPPRARYVNNASARRGDGWSCAAPTHRACPPAHPPCVVRVRAAVLCSRVRGRAAGVRSSGVRVPTQRAVCRFFAWFLLTSGAAASSSSRVKRAARGARRCWRLDGCVMQLPRV